MKRFFLLAAVILILAGCAPTTPRLTPIIVNITSTPRVVEVTTTPEPTALLPSLTSKPSGEGISFIDSGQNLEPVRSWDIALGDLDGDGDFDAVTTNDSAEGTKAWFNNGQGIFSISNQRFDPSLSVVLGDLDRDRDLDIVVTNWDINADDWLNGHRGASVWLNDGSGTFSKKQEDLGGDLVFNMDLGDLNGDGNLDIFFAGANTNTIWLNDGAGNFVDSGQKFETGIDAAIVLGDLDGDSDLDALIGGWDGPPKVWLNDGAANFSEKYQNMTRNDLHIHGLSVGDLDEDGDLDAFAALANGGPHEIWLNDGTGLFSPAQTLSAPLAQGVALGDIDGDGDLDAATAHGYQTGGHIRVWLNSGDGAFTDSLLKLGNAFSSAIALGDLDKDGYLDIFAAHTQWQPQGLGEPDRVWLNETIPSVSVIVPEGNPPTLDGTLAYGEWDSATVETFADGSELLLMHADSNLYLGIRSNTPGMIAGNIFVQRGDEISIFHSSAALGTAVYQKGEDSWRQIQDFTWQCRDTGYSDAAQVERDAFLQQEGWVAANSRMGIPEELEYRIELAKNTLRLAVNFIRASNTDQKIPWPADLEDDCIRLTPGGLPENLYFLPTQWATIKVSK